ncbi:MAG: hypothetical protein IT355_02335 [Gemmatimonadaceae bacterium]|nr:hypothetical protein [Gemmatimonadaceae bacterium]
MHRVLLVGPGGAGKTTLARQLGDITGLPVVHLDALYWRAGWVSTPKDEWEPIVERLCSAPTWIMDGNFGGTIDQRLAACDTVLLLDLAPWRCLWRVLTRTVRYAGRSRPDMAPDCPERFDAAFLWWIATYRRKKLPALLARLEAARGAGTNVVILRTPDEVERFLADVRATRDAVATAAVSPR